MRTVLRRLLFIFLLATIIRPHCAEIYRNSCMRNVVETAAETSLSKMPVRSRVPLLPPRALSGVLKPEPASDIEGVLDADSPVVSGSTTTPLIPSLVEHFHVTIDEPVHTVPKIFPFIGTQEASVAEEVTEPKTGAESFTGSLEITPLSGATEEAFESLPSAQVLSTSPPRRVPLRPHRPTVPPQDVQHVPKNCCWDVLKEMGWTLTAPKNTLELAMINFFLLLEATGSDHREWKFVIQVLDVLQREFADKLPPRDLVRLASCECQPELGRNCLQAVVASGNDKAMDSRFLSALWRTLQRGRPISAMVDNQLNNLLHLAVLSLNPNMLEKVFQRIDRTNAPLDILHLLSNKNASGKTPLDLTRDIPASVASGVKADLIKRYKLASSFIRFKSRLQSVAETQHK